MNQASPPRNQRWNTEASHTATEQISTLSALSQPSPKTTMPLVALYCGSRAGHNPVYREQAILLASQLAQQQLGVVYGVTRVFEKIVPKVKFASLSEIVDEIRSRMVKEVDFVAEAQNIEDFQQFLNATQNTQAIAPKVYSQASTRRVLTMQRLYGVPLTDLDVVKQHAKDPAQVLISAMNTWFASLMMCKSFHADLHAGNLLLLKDGRIGFIDFGIVGQLKPEVWGATLGFMDALQHTNYREMAKNMVNMGMTHTTVDVDRLAQDMEKIFSGVLLADPQKVMSGDVADLNAIMLDMVGVGERHGIHFPRDFALLMKQMLYFDRFMRVLTPYMDVFSDSRLQLMQDTQPISKLIH
ncbi:MAG: AarF/ABC1/UbiB kinase family protein [Moraxellaceae bacterium]|nr:MAG: AarF/ABC1/UbiB kinase family protein [Moraxellaceae bacterium]